MIDWQLPTFVIRPVLILDNYTVLFVFLCCISMMYVSVCNKYIMIHKVSSLGDI